ncbi:MAG: hypothetical protein ABFS19_10090 [Thermodesulfobacteriota bacterium]
MKYLITILLFAIGVTLLTVFLFTAEDSSVTDDVVLTVNDHHFSREDLEEKHLLLNDNDNDVDRYRPLINRELLIQEAQRQGIDTEESFRQALKNYYEQSLVKILTDRQYESLTVKVDPARIDRYLSRYGKQFVFTVINGNQKDVDSESSQEILFDELPTPLAILLFDKEPGQIVQWQDTGNSMDKIRLERIEELDGSSSTLPSRESVQLLLAEDQKEQMISGWIQELSTNASIIIYEEGEKR